MCKGLTKDTDLYSHMKNNRTFITGLKIQSLIICLHMHNWL